MNVCVIGTGYVGLVTGTCLAEMGNRVWCIDINARKIAGLKHGIIPIYEPGLEELVKRNVKENRLFFSTELKEGLDKALYCFISVGTPAKEDGEADVSDVLQVAATIGKFLQHYLIVVDKSTVPVGTANLVRQTISKQLTEREVDIEFDVVSNPEFLKEGAAVEDFMRPDRIIIGTDNIRTAELMKQLYEPFVCNQNPIIVMDIPSAEMSKYASNAMLATRISFMNEMARLCDQIGADINKVRVGMGSDKRIGMSFLYAGPGYGGSCFPKDVKELIHSGKRYASSMKLLEAVNQVNDEQKGYIIKLVRNHFGGDLRGRNFALWGLAFKPQTDDMREAPALVVINELIKYGAYVTAYDPQATEQAKMLLGDISGIEYVDDMMEALNQKDALIILTEWRQFRQPDFIEIKKRMRQAIIFDGRNIYDGSKLRQLGYEYYCIGRNCVGKVPVGGGV